MKKGNRVPEPATGIIPEIKETARARRKRNREARAAEQTIGRRRNNLTPELEIRMVETDTLLPATNRVRQESERQIATCCQAMSAYGVCTPLLIDKNGQIIDGHARWEAAKRLGLRCVPCIEITHLTETEIRALRLALNRLGETGEWDFENLRIGMQELIELGEDLIVTGFEAAEIDSILISEEVGDGDEGSLPPLPANPVSRPGDLWTMRHHRLAQADARHRSIYLKIIDIYERARIVLTDVPYNVPIRKNVTSDDRHRESAVALAPE